MDLKRFSQESRKRLMSGVARRLLYWGFDAEGNCTESVSKVPGGYQFRGAVHDDPGVPALWDALKVAIGRKGVEVIVEEAAYTWFNRMMAMQILSKQGFEEPQLDFAGGDSLVPQILKRAQQGHAPFLSPEEKSRLDVLVGIFTRDQEALALLISGFCHHHKTLSRVFGKPDDYTELLLPDDMLKETGFLHLLNTTDALTDEEYQKVELIGWLYQFYISERKDEVFAAFGKGKKAEAKDIPAATQIFTPNWIVKYMVENTAGKAWLDRFPDSPLKGQMQYIVENESDGSREPIIGDVEELTLIDPACGSGHILVEGFDLLYKMYLERYYSPEEAVDSILKRNLFGLDIDDRAAQLATFAVLLKAAKYDRDVWSRGVLPQVFAMPEAKPFNPQETKDFLGPDGAQYASSLQVALNRMQDAKNLGSVMKLELSHEAQEFIAFRYKSLQSSDSRNFNEETVLRDISPFIPPLLALTRKYTAVVANPPYMGQKNMNAELKAYINKHYPISKSDLFAVFMEAMIAMLSNSARVGCITMESWMFLSSYERLRQELIEKYSIATLAHFGWHIIGIAFGTAVLVLEKSKAVSIGEYSYLTIDDIDKRINRPRIFPVKDNGRYARIPQTNFAKIPGSPIAYWASEKSVGIFQNSPTLNYYGDLSKGLSTGENDRFIRAWYEIQFDRIQFELEPGCINELPWVPCKKGGGGKKWFGYNEWVIDWRSNGQPLKDFKPRSVIRSPQNYFKSIWTWSKISSNGISFRFNSNGFVPIDAVSYLCPKDDSLWLLGLLNSSVTGYFMSLISPTLNFEIGQVSSMPIIEGDIPEIQHVVEKCVALSRFDWNANEISWDFQCSPLINQSHKLDLAYEAWRVSVSDIFFQLHLNEEKLNRIFIETYDLPNELVPEVRLKQITILQDELDSDDLEALEDEFRVNGRQSIELPLKRDVVMQQFLSYCVGLMMGRYRLDRPGLNIAHPNPTAAELNFYFYNGHQVEIDEDAILPIMGSDCQFPDDVLHRVYGLLDVIWGEGTRTANVNFLEECLGKSLEKYLVKDFFKDHCRRYKKKPIYWLFASKKGAFQVLVYMHRMNAFTVEKIRSNYLLEHLKHLRQEEQRLAANALNLSTRDAKRLDKLRKDIAECEAYDLDLKDVADRQIAFDLDDGVTANHKLFGSVVAPIK